MTEQARRRREYPQPTPVLAPGQSYESVTDKISAIVLQQQGVGWGWAIGFGIAFLLVMVLFAAIAYLFAVGVGIWGIQIPVAWGFAIVNFVWWIGIGHAGTLISAILLLLRQEWRTSINRFAEAMTLFAVACAGLFPVLHLGRPWFFYWLIPYPATTGMWPQFRSPLVWDFFAISTYGLVSLMFWYMGLVPDMATLRDRTQNRRLQYIYGFFAMGWRNSVRHWQRYNRAYLLMAALATPLVVSVHSIVSFDFAVAIVPGWHSTVFPPYFVAGAIYSGFAMVMTLAIPLRWAYGLQDFITMQHLNNMAKIMLATSLIVAYGYILETFMAWYSGNRYEEYMILNRMFGPYAFWYWVMIACNVLFTQLFWSQRLRHNLVVLFVISLTVNIGMWLERFIIVVTSLSRDFLPSSWGYYTPSVWDWATFIGTLGLFVALIFLFVRVLPLISIFEMRELVTEVEEEEQRRQRRVAQAPKDEATSLPS